MILGNFHSMIMYKEEDTDKANEVLRRMVYHALDLDGTCTGEHGIGIGKKMYLVDELGAGTVRFMKHIKRSIDPLNLFNPGKVSTWHCLKSQNRLLTLCFTVVPRLAGCQRQQFCVYNRN